jgi:pimeloyl-ACP methyl ester carboxylesterase
VLTGRVYDDRSGQPIADATVQLLNGDGSPASAFAATTDHLGRYRVSAAPGSARVRITKEGSTAADVRADVADGRRSDPDDARLTGVDAVVGVISAVAGGTVVSSGGTRLVVPPAALALDRTIRLTDVSPQGSVRRLPLGWTPLAIVDVSGDAEFAADAALTVRVPAIPAGRTITLARWDPTSGAWIAAGTAAPTADGTALEAVIARSGQFAFAIEDLPPDNPPVPIVGAALTGVAPRPPPSIQLSLSPSPRVLFAQPGARSAVTGTAVPSVPLPSGTPLVVDLAETLTFSNGSLLKPWPGTRRLAMFRSGDNSLAATFTVGPSRELTPFAIRQGAIDLAGRVPSDPNAPRGRVFGAAGGTFTASGGERVIVPAGAAAEDLPVDIATIPADQFPLAIPTASTLIRALTLDFHGAPIGRDVELSVPSPDPLPPGATVAVVNITDVGDATRLILAATAQPDAGALVTTVDPRGDSSVDLVGIREEGRYAFLRVDSAMSFVTGTVTANGLPVSGALIEIPDGTGSALASLTDSAGQYVLLATAGTHDVRVTNPANADSTTVSVTVEAGTNVTNLPVPLGTSPPVVLAMSPANGAANVPLGSGVSLTFSEPIDAATIAGAAALSTGGLAIPGTLSLAPGNTALTFLPSTLLQSDTVYEFTLAATVRDLAGHAMAGPFAGSFRTIDVTPPAVPAPGAIVASIPSASGNSTITGSPGTADPAGRVIVRNLRTGAQTFLTPNEDGSFSGIVAARSSDRLELTICDNAVLANPQETNICGTTGRGHPTTVQVAPFRNADGSVVVGTAGGRVEGAAGVFVDIPRDALPDGTVVRVSPLIAADFPIGALPEFPFIAGVDLDLGGVVPRQALDIGIAAPPDASLTDQVIVGRVGTIAGRQVWSVYDRAHLVNGRYETASPPFMGVISEGSYGFLRIVNNCMSWVTVNFQFQGHYGITIFGIPFVNFTTDATTATLPAVCNSMLDLQVVTLDTEQVIQSLTYRAPAVRDEIQLIPDTLSDDRTAPVLVGRSQPASNQIDRFEMTFSEPMNAASVRNGLLLTDGEGVAVPGTIEFFDGFRRMVFRPAVPFHPGELYTVSLFGATDLAGNVFAGDPVTFMPFNPESLSQFQSIPELNDILSVCRSATTCDAAAVDVAFIGDTLFIANGLRNANERYESTASNPSRLIAVDISDPRNPQLIGFHSTQTNPRALAVVRDAQFPLTNRLFSGDLLLVAGGGRVAGGELASKLEIYEVTACTTRPLSATLSNCLEAADRGWRLLSTPAGTIPADGVPPASGVAQQLAALHSRALAPAGDTVIAYVLTVPLGVMAVDIPQAFGSIADADGDRGPHAFFSGDFIDVGVLKNRVVTLEPPGPGGISSLHVFSPELLPLQEVVLGDPATRLELVPNIVVDIDADGNLGVREDEDEDIGVDIKARDELFDLGFVSSALPAEDCPGNVVCGALTVVDLSALTDLLHAGPPQVVARIPLAGQAFSLDVDAGRLMAYVEIRGHGLGVIDLGFLRDALSNTAVETGIDYTGLLDADHDGVDDRILRVFPKQDIFLTRLKVDFTTGVAYASGATSGPELIQVCNVCNELALDFRPVPSAGAVRTLQMERDAVGAIVARARERLAQIRIEMEPEPYFLEQGSGACLWATPNATEQQLAADCARTGYELGTSDHDIEVMVPTLIVEAAQLILNNTVEEALNADPPLVADLNMFAVPQPSFAAAVLPVNPPIDLVGADPTGDLGMARQQLMLLWLLTGEYIGQGPLDLEAVLARLRTPTIPGQASNIPTFEGYERALLEEFNFHNSGVLLRIKGACENNGQRITLSREAARSLNITDPGRNFDNLPNVLSQDCQQELHSVAKAASRAALGRIVADPEGNELLLRMTRERYRSNGGCRTGVDNPTTPPLELATYTTKPCGSFEEYIASTAVQSVLDDLEIFTPSEARQVVRFACIKVGGAHCRDRFNDPVRLPGVPILQSDNEANAFIAEALEFIEMARTRTSDAYPYDGGGLAQAADPILLNEAPGGTPFFLDVDAACIVRGISLEQFSTRAMLRRCNEAIVLQSLEEAKARVRKQFAVRALNLGANTIDGLNVKMYDGNGLARDDYQILRTYDLSLRSGEIRSLDVEPDPANPGTSRAIFDHTFEMEELPATAPFAMAFMLDSPNRVPEANREDNVTGFFYYKLDVDDPGVPTTADAPVAPDDTTPDPNCIPQPRLDFQLTIQGPSGPVGFGSPEATTGVYQTVRLTYRVRNIGEIPLRDVEVVRDGQLVFSVGTLAPGASETRTSLFTPTQARLFNLIGVATAKDEDGNLIGPEIGSALLTVTADNQPFSVELFDASPLNVLGHPFTRYHLAHDQRNQDIPVLGATTDGDDSGGGARLRIVVRGLTPNAAAQVSLVDADVSGATDGIGRLVDSSNAPVSAVTANGQGEATVYYVPPSVFVREAHNAADHGWPAMFLKKERNVTFTVTQAGQNGGQSRRNIVLRRPPVFLIHGLFSTADSWKDFQPLVPENLTSFAAFEGFDGRFDVFAIGGPYATAPFAEGAAGIQAQMKSVLGSYLPSFAFGKVDIVGHSMGGVLARRLTNDDPLIRAAVRKIIALNSPFAGSELANKIVQFRDEIPINASETDVMSALSSIARNPDRVLGPNVKPLALADICAAAIQGLDLTLRFNLTGAVDDLQTTSAEIQRLLAGGIRVPSHHIVGGTTDEQTDLGIGFSPVGDALFMSPTEAMWNALGLMCNLTPDPETLETTVLLKTKKEALTTVIAIAKLAKLRGAARTKAWLGFWEDANKMAIKELLIGNDPTPIFSGINDRVVSEASQRAGLPADTLAMTAMDGRTDHVVVRHTPAITVEACQTFDPVEGPRIRSDFRDLNADRTLDITCRVMFLIEADPAGNLFFRN